MKIKTMMPTEMHQKLRDELFAVLQTYGSMPTAEAIGVLSQILGQVLAIVETNGPPVPIEEWLDVINKNIKSGKEAGLLQIMQTKGRA